MFSYILLGLAGLAAMFLISKLCDFIIDRLVDDSRTS